MSDRKTRRIEEWRKTAQNIVATGCRDWGIESFKSAFVCEYADAHFYREELHRAWGMIWKLMGRNSALSRRLAKYKGSK